MMSYRISHLAKGADYDVALARTLVNDPPAILADEPTGNLDPSTREHVLNFLEQLSRDGRTVVMVTHDPSAAERARRTLHLSDGAVRADSGTRTQRVA